MSNMNNCVWSEVNHSPIDANLGIPIGHHILCRPPPCVCRIWWPSIIFFSCARSEIGCEGRQILYYRRAVFAAKAYGGWPSILIVACLRSKALCRSIPPYIWTLWRPWSRLKAPSLLPDSFAWESQSSPRVSFVSAISSMSPQAHCMPYAGRGRWPSPDP
jgi:hypothetical protein